MKALSFKNWLFCRLGLLAALIAATAYADEIRTGGARVIENPTQDGNLVLRVNDGGVKKDAITVTGSTGDVVTTGSVGVGVTPTYPLDVQSTAGNSLLSRFVHQRNGASVFSITQHRNAASSPDLRINFDNSRGSIATPAIVANNDTLGTLNFQGYQDSSTAVAAAVIQAKVDGTPGASNDMPGRLEFYTVPDGSSSPVERLRISANGAVTARADLMMFDSSQMGSGNNTRVGFYYEAVGSGSSCTSECVAQDAGGSHGFSSGSGVCIAAWNDAATAPISTCGDSTGAKICLCAGAIQQ